MKIKMAPTAMTPLPVPSSDPFRKGWDVYNLGTSKEPILEIQRNEQVPDEWEIDIVPNTMFARDSAALIYVMQRACRDGCPDAREAIRAIVKSWK